MPRSVALAAKFNRLRAGLTGLRCARRPPPSRGGPQAAKHPRFDESRIVIQCRDRRSQRHELERAGRTARGARYRPICSAPGSPPARSHWSFCRRPATWPSEWRRLNSKGRAPRRLALLRGSAAGVAKLVRSGCKPGGRGETCFGLSGRSRLRAGAPRRSEHWHLQQPKGWQGASDHLRFS
jgi:hypothetical protein